MPAAVSGDDGRKVADGATRLSVEGLTKRFGTLVANDNISFAVRPGELHCILGENGAGKSTLSSCLYGLLRPDSGTIRYDGRITNYRSPKHAIADGIGMVHQHFTLVSAFTGMENIFVSSSAGDRADAERRVAALCSELGLTVDLGRPVSQLSVGEQQWIEILVALSGNARLLILDEPTAVLTPQESLKLFVVIRRLCARGVSVILISHKLDEVLRCDQITVIRRGRVVATVEAGATSKEELAALMVGREVSLSASRERAPASRVPMLEVQHLTVGGERGVAINDASFAIHRGEILGLAAVAGNGQDELFEALVGMRPPQGDATIILDGVAITGRTPGAIAAAGVGYVPSDRYRDGLVAEFSVAENLLLGHQHDAAFRHGPFLNGRAMRVAAAQSVEDFDIRTTSVDTPMRTLSGGNAQKAILARELPLATKCLLCNQPTRGLDVGVIEYVRRQILERRAAGCAVLLASEDLDDLLLLADRIMVLFRGKVMGIVDAAAADLRTLGLMMAGQSIGAGG